MVANEPVRLDTPLDALTDMRRGNLALGRVSPDTWTNLNTVLALVEPSEAGGRPGPHFHGALVKRRPQVDIALDTDFMRFAHELAETEPNARTAASTLEKWMRAQAGTSRNDDGAGRDARMARAQARSGLVWGAPPNGDGQHQSAGRHECLWLLECGFLYAGTIIKRRGRFGTMRDRGRVMATCAQVGRPRP